MKIRKSVLKQDLRNLPIDHGDMFLMSQTDDLIDASEIAEIMPWEAEETQRRLAALVALGLLEWVNERGEPIDPVKRDTDPPFYVAVTLRPKAPEPVADLFRQTETSVVALRSQDHLLLLDQAVIHNDRSVFARATFVKQERPLAEGPVFATARPPLPNTQELIHFSLPPLSGVVPATPAAVKPTAPMAAPEREEHLSLPPFLGNAPAAAARSPALASPLAQDDMVRFSLPPFLDDAASEPLELPARMAPDTQEDIVRFSLPPDFDAPLPVAPPVKAAVPVTLRSAARPQHGELARYSLPPFFEGDVREPDAAANAAPALISLPPFPEDEPVEPGLRARSTQLHERPMEPIRFKEPVFVGPKVPAPAKRKGIGHQHEAAAVFSRATVPGDAPVPGAMMQRSTLVYEKQGKPSVYERATVVDEDADERAQSERESVRQQGGVKRR